VKTTDGGLTWQTLSSPVGTVYSMCFTSNNFGIIAGNTSGVYRTQDGGANWLEIAFPSPNKFISVHFPDNQTAFACGMKDALTPCMIKSTDGGMKWTEVAVPVGLGLNVVFFRNDHLGYAGGFGGTIIKTTDGGATWVRQTTPDQGLIHSIFFTDDNHGFAGGAALIRTDNGGTANGIFENNVSGQVLIHPNPAREMVTVSIDKPGTGGELTVYNRQGAKILQRQVALFPVEINVSGWADGLYLVRISDDDKLTWTGKLKK
jgi:photosystem II stability/assembly factor-like uncharacterized protein